MTVKTSPTTMRPVAVSLLLWISLVAAGTQLQLMFKSSLAFSALNDHQRRCSASDVHSAARASRCDDKACFCASPQTMSDDTDDCMLTLGGTYNVKDIYTADTYNGVMTFFANECGTFEVQLKEAATQVVTYKTVPTQTNFGSGPKATGGAGTGSGENNSKNNNINVNVTGGGTSNVNISDGPKESEAPSSGLKIDAIIGIVASVATVIGVIVAVYVKRCRGK